MTSWSEAKFKYCVYGIQETSSHISVEGIEELPAKMPPKAICYEIREKASKSSSLLFTGIVNVPAGQLSGSIWTNLTKYFDGNSADMKGLHDQAEVKGSWENLNNGVRDGIIFTDNMFEKCWENLRKREMFTPDQVRDIVFKPKKTEEVQRSVEKVNEVSVETTKHETVKYVDGAGSSIVEEGPGGENIMKQLESQEAGIKDMLVWCLFDGNGQVSNTYTYDEKAVLGMKQIIRKNPGTSAAEFYFENGIKMIPILHSENETLRQKVDKLEQNLLTTQEKLKEATIDRDTRANEAMAFGTREIKEMSKVKCQKDAAEATVAVLRDQVATLEKTSNCLDALEELHTKMNGLSVKVDSLDEKATGTATVTQKTSTTVDRIVNMIGMFGNEKDRKVKLWTSAATKMEAIPGKFIILAKDNFFSQVKQLKSLNKDVGNMTSKHKLDRFVLKGEGPEIAESLLLKEGNQGGEGKYFSILIIDGADKVSPVGDQKPKVDGSTEQQLSRFQKIKIKSAAEIFATALKEDSNVGEILIVVGPSTEESEARELLWSTLMEEMTGSNVTFLNMTNLAKSVGDDTVEKWIEDDAWSHLGVNYFFSQAAWWAEDPRNRSAAIETMGDEVCTDCGLLHDEKNCLKEEIAEAKLKKVEVEEFKDVRENVEDGGRSKGREKNNNRNPRQFCKTCKGFHSMPCHFDNPNYRPNNRKHHRSEESQSRGSDRADKHQKFDRKDLKE